MRTVRTTWLIGAMALLVTACTGGVDPPTGRADDDRDPSVRPLPPVSGAEVPATEDGVSTAAAPDVAPSDVALIDVDGRLALLRGVAMADVDGERAVLRGGAVAEHPWGKFRARASLDGSAVVLTLPDDAVRSWGSTLVDWVSIPSGEPLGEQRLDGLALQATATSTDGDLVGLVSVPDGQPADAIAGSRTTSDIVLLSRDRGVVYERTLDGNFVPEAFGRATDASGLPELVFLLEYVPAESPRFYRVRVLSTASGEVSLPLNLRNKLEQVDERMAGFSRSQVVADEHGLLFTLYRGTIDGSPDGQPYAFVHTLDFADGVWCLDVDPALELDRFEGSLAVGGDRLYVASANGVVGAFEIPSITDPDRAPTMDWVVEIGVPGKRAPAAVAGEEHVTVAYGDGTAIDVAADGVPGQLTPLPGFGPAALSRLDDGSLVAFGEGWSTFGRFDVPPGLAEVAAVFIER